MPDHQDDSYGACTVCREYVPHTDEETVKVAWPCPTVRLDAALARERRLRAVIEQARRMNDLRFLDGIHAETPEAGS